MGTVTFTITCDTELIAKGVSPNNVGMIVDALVERYRYSAAEGILNIVVAAERHQKEE